jgi:hypothetical protein
MHGHFQVLGADDRFSSLPIGLYRNVGADLAYEIIVSIEDERLDLISELADWASERGLESRFNDAGEVALFEPVSMAA